MDEGQNQDGGAVGGIFSSNESGEKGSAGIDSGGVRGDVDTGADDNAGQMTSGNGFETFAQTGANQPATIASGPVMPVSDTNDIVFSGGGGGGRPKKGLMIIFVLVAIFVSVALGAFAIWKLGAPRKDEAEAQDAAMIFGTFRNLLLSGSEDSEKVDNSDWAIDEIINVGVYSAEDEEYLVKVKNNYDLYWGMVDQDDKTNMLYDQYFRLYYICANRNAIIGGFSNLEATKIDDYVSELIDIEKKSGIMRVLATAESNYFVNYGNEEANGYLAQVLALVDLTNDNFKKMTEDIFEKLEKKNV